MEEATADPPPSIQRGIKKYLHCNLAQAQLSEQALQDLAYAYTQAAEKTQQ